MRVFKIVTKTRKQLFFVFINTFESTENQYDNGITARLLTLENLFLDIS